MPRRILELETANIRLQDEVAALRGEGPGASRVNVPETAPPSLDV